MAAPLRTTVSPAPARRSSDGTVTTGGWLASENFAVDPHFRRLAKSCCCTVTKRLLPKPALPYPETGAATACALVSGALRFKVPVATVEIVVHSESTLIGSPALKPVVADTFSAASPTAAAAVSVWLASGLPSSLLSRVFALHSDGVVAFCVARPP